MTVTFSGTLEAETLVAHKNVALPIGRAMALLAAAALAFALHFGIHGTQAYGSLAWYGMNDVTATPGGVWLLEGWYDAIGDSSNTIELSETMRGIWPWAFTAGNSMYLTPMYQLLLAGIVPYFGTVFGFSLVNVALLWAASLLLYRLAMVWFGQSPAAAFFAAFFAATFPGLIIELTAPMYYVLAFASLMLALYAVATIEDRFSTAPPIGVAVSLGVVLGLVRLVYPEYTVWVLVAVVAWRWGWRRGLAVAAAALLVEAAWVQVAAPAIFTNASSMAATARARIVRQFFTFAASADGGLWIEVLARFAGRAVMQLSLAFMPVVLTLAALGLPRLLLDARERLVLTLIASIAVFAQVFVLQLSVPYYIPHLFFWLTPAVFVAAGTGLSQVHMAIGKRIGTQVAGAVAATVLAAHLALANADTLFGWYQPFILMRHGAHLLAAEDLTYPYDEIVYRPGRAGLDLIESPEFWREYRARMWQRFADLRQPE